MDVRNSDLLHYRRHPHSLRFDHLLTVAINVDSSFVHSLADWSAVDHDSNYINCYFCLVIVDLIVVNDLDSMIDCYH